MSIHVRNEALKMVDEWKSRGFNGVRFIECRVEDCLLQDFLDDGKTEQDYEQWISDYAAIIAHPDLGECDCHGESKYVSVEFDAAQFYRDLESEIRRRMGGDVKIRRYAYCNEFEIQREAT